LNIVKQNIQAPHHTSKTFLSVGHTKKGSCPWLEIPRFHFPSSVPASESPTLPFFRDFLFYLFYFATTKELSGWFDLENQDDDLLLLFLFLSCSHKLLFFSCCLLFLTSNLYY